MKWQPIETAPKDGTHFLVYRPTQKIEEAWWKEDQFNKGRMVLGDKWSHFGKQCFPTHWMPLPEAPTNP